MKKILLFVVLALMGLTACRQPVPATLQVMSFNVRNSAAAQEFRVITESFNGVPFISDHYPIQAILTY